MLNIPRTCGILLHPTSLPGRYGIGDLGPDARRFVDFLEKSGLTLWQVLPLGPAGPLNSPYSAPSAFAGNVLMISPDLLERDGLVRRETLAAQPALDALSVDFGAVIPSKLAILDEAYRTFMADRGGRFARMDQEYRQFTGLNADWLHDYALFRAIKDQDESRIWNSWDLPLARREPSALREARTRHADLIEKHTFLQFLFFRQWDELREYCRQHHVRLVGDIPIFVAYDSVDVWSHPEAFKLDENLHPTVVSGVPPDYFSPTGQLWGTPLYNWDSMRKNNFQWWIERISHMLELVDIVRIDHFRGFAACWEVPAGHPTAEYGSWVPVPGTELFTAMKKAIPSLPVIAEDLGMITPDVVELREAFGFPGMRILQFAFSSSAQVPQFIPHNYVKNTVAYTGTHDNDTTLGWYRQESPASRQSCADYFTSDGEHAQSPEDFEKHVSWTFIREAMSSTANIAIFPLQDVLGLGSEGRMNFPSDDQDRWWRWRFTWDALGEGLSGRLHRLCELHGRLRPRFPQKMR